MREADAPEHTLTPTPAPSVTPVPKPAPQPTPAPEPTPTPSLDPTPSPEPTPTPQAPSKLCIEGLTAQLTDEGFKYSYSVKSNYVLTEINSCIVDQDGMAVQLTFGSVGKGKTESYGNVDAPFQRLWEMGTYKIVVNATDETGKECSKETTVYLPFDLGDSATPATSWKVWIPANYKLTCYSNADDTTPSPHWIRARDQEYAVKCDAKKRLSNGSIRYHFVTSDKKSLWFTYDDSVMSWMAW